MCISARDNDYIRSTFRREGGDQEEGNIIIGLLDSVCQARIDCYQLPLRRAGLSDIHNNSAADKLCKIAVVAVLPEGRLHDASLATRRFWQCTNHLWHLLKSTTATTKAHHCCKGIKGKLGGTHLEKKQIKYVAICWLIWFVVGGIYERIVAIPGV